MMTCPRCDGLVVSEYLLDPREGSLSGFHAARCVNCGAIHDNVIRTNQRVPPSLGRVRSPRHRVGPRVPKKRVLGALAPLGWMGEKPHLLRTRLLVVDDDPDLRNVLQERLTQRGYTVETSGNQHDALTKLDRAAFDGVLLDDRIPGISGLTALRHIRQHHPLLSVVMMTDETDSLVAAQARAAGARACLCKPLNQGTLEQVVQSWFGTAV